MGGQIQRMQSKVMLGIFFGFFLSICVVCVNYAQLNKERRAELCVLQDEGYTVYIDSYKSDKLPDNVLNFESIVNSEDNRIDLVQKQESKTILLPLMLWR